MPYTPMPGKILVRILKNEKVVSGLVIVEKEKKDERPVLAEVTALSPNHEWNNADAVKPGDHILIQGYSGKWIDESIFGSSEEYRSIYEDEMLALVSRESR